MRKKPLPDDVMTPGGHRTQVWLLSLVPVSFVPGDSDQCHQHGCPIPSGLCPFLATISLCCFCLVPHSI